MHFRLLKNFKDIIYTHFSEKPLEWITLSVSIIALVLSISNQHEATKLKKRYDEINLNNKINEIVNLISDDKKTG